MAFNSQDRKIESGKNFAKKQSPDCYKLYHKYNSIFIKLLTDKIDKEKSVIVDYGGGNSLLSQQIISSLNKQKIKCFIDVIDIDSTKRVRQKNLYFIKADVLKYHKTGYYDYGLSRFLLHYFNKKQLEKFIRNVYSSLKTNSYFLLINWVIDDNRVYKKKRQILDIIEKEKKITCRTIPKTSEIIDICKKSGFSIIKMKKVNYSIKINDFYKNRFQLSNKTVRKIIEDTKIKSHRESQIGLLLKK